MLAALLAGCRSESRELERGLKLRDTLLEKGCSFQTEITADYGDSIQSFCVECTGTGRGDLKFTVTEPESISGIQGTLSCQGGALTFDDTVLVFPLLADGRLSPVSAPWIFLNTLRSGYLTSAGTEGAFLRLTIDDSYEDDALHLDIWVDGDEKPVRAEILYDGRRILSLDIKNFTLM